MASPGPRGLQHVWKPIIIVPEGEAVAHVFHGCACGAQRRGIPGARHGVTYAYRPAGSKRWQERSPWCARPVAEPVRSRKGGGR